MNTASGSPIETYNSEGQRFSKLQIFIKNAVDNAGIGYTQSGYLKPINLYDSEGLRFAKLGAWLTLLADNIAGGGGGAGVSGVDATLTSTADLTAIPMVGKTPPILKVFSNETSLTMEMWRALASSAADDPTNGVARADDWATSGIVWFRRGA